MNTDIVKAKNKQLLNPFEQRLAKMEEILGGLMAKIGQDAQNNSINTMDNRNSLQKNFYSDGEKSTIHMMATVYSTNFNKKTSKNRLLLSQTQIIAELAAVILRQNNRD